MQQGDDIELRKTTNIFGHNLSIIVAIKTSKLACNAWLPSKRDCHNSLILHFILKIISWEKWAYGSNFE